ncbi:hypothetical protein BY996DRAFT_8556816 [Phakopsora pachyrhizi]|nr:hypothetical protein BY996DRAFT_8556816 [Phakopsora pachyrhizi]
MAWLAINPVRPFPILELPSTVILNIFSSLDLPDLASISGTGNQTLINLSTDSVLHPLPGKQAQQIGSGQGLLPLLSELYQTFENSKRINRLMISDRLNRALARRPIRCELHNLNLIDEEVITNVSNLLAPIVRTLKRQRAKDELARQMRSSNESLIGTYNSNLSYEGDDSSGIIENLSRGLMIKDQEDQEGSKEYKKFKKSNSKNSWIDFKSTIQKNGNRYHWKDDLNENVRLALEKYQLL